MHRVLVDSKLKPLGELVEGERDLLGATEQCAAAPARLLINSELKPLGEKVEGQRDLLGATEVWQAVW